MYAQRNVGLALATIWIASKLTPHMRLPRELVDIILQYTSRRAPPKSVEKSTAGTKPNTPAINKPTLDCFDDDGEGWESELSDDDWSNCPSDEDDFEDEFDDDFEDEFDDDEFYDEEEEEFDDDEDEEGELPGRGNIPECKHQ